MAYPKRRFVRGVVAAGAATCLAATAVAAAPTSAATGTTLRVAITKHGMYVNGPTAFPAGRVKLYIDASGKERGVEVVQFAPGYTWSDYRADFKVVAANLFAPNGNTKKGLRHLNHIINHTTFYGGLYAMDGQIRHGTILLTKPGRYVLYDDSSFPKRPVNLTVGAPVGPQTLPAFSGKVIAQTNRRFTGSKVLPAKGDIKFKNESTESPHFLVFQRVKEGTTRRDVLNAFQGQGPPPFLAAEQDIDTLSHNQKMTVHLHLPAGEYAEMCFFPDPKTGMPHAFMGMVRIVHLK